MTTTLTTPTATTTTATTTTATTTTATTTTNPRRRVARVLTGLLLTLGSVLGITATNAAPAQAASYVEGCFRGGTGGSYWGASYQVQAYWQGSWYTIFNGTLDRNSCAQVNIGTSNWQYPLRLVVHHRVGTALFSGVSPYNAPAGSGRWNVGTGFISCYGCR